MYQKNILNTILSAEDNIDDGCRISNIAREEDFMQKIPTSSAQGVLVGGGVARVVVDNLNPILYESAKTEGKTHPDPLQYTLASLCACTVFSVDMISKELGMKIDNIETTADAKIDPSGMNGVASIKPYYSSIDQVVRIKTKDRDRLPDLQNGLKQRCPMLNLVQDTGLPYTIKYEIV